MIKGVLFDLDGVIIDTTRYHFEAWQDMAWRIGIRIDESFNNELKGVSRSHALEKILEISGKADAYDAEEKSLLSAEKNRRYREFIKMMSTEDILPGVKDFLFALRDRGIRMAMGSSSQSALIVLGQIGLVPFFDFIVDVSEILRTKPEPDIYIDALRGLSLRADEVVGIEDSDVGVMALRGANVFSIGIGVNADLRIESTAELSMELIESIHL